VTLVIVVGHRESPQAVAWASVQLQGQSALPAAPRQWALAQIACGFPQVKSANVQLFTNNQRDTL
jgi:hypothetical protein